MQLFCIWLSVKTSFCSCHKPSLNKYIYIFFIGKTMKHNLFLQCCLHFAILLWHPRQKNKKKQPYVSTQPIIDCALYRRESAYTMGPKLGATNLEAGLLILVLWPIFGSRIWPLFWGHKTQTGSTQYGQQVCYCRRKLTAAHIRDTPRVHCMPEKFALPLIWGSGFGALGPPRLWEKASPMP